MDIETDKNLLNEQNPHWEKTYTSTPEMFGKEPSEPAKKAAELFRKEGAIKVLELGAGQGRDTLFFARSGFQIHALDYSEPGVITIQEKAQAALSPLITQHINPYGRFELDMDARLPIAA